MINIKGNGARTFLSAIVLTLFFLCFFQSFAAAAGDSEIRQKLTATILASGEEQQKALAELADTGAKVVRDVLTAWPREQLIIYESGATKIPAIIDDEADANGTVRATRVDNGEFLKDENGAVLRLATTDVTPAETDARLRSAIQQALDLLTLSGPDPDARRSAVLKLGNSGKIQNVQLLEKRFEKEKESEIRKTIQESIALLQLGSPEPQTQVSALETLKKLDSIGALDSVKKLTVSTNGDVAAAAHTTVVAIEEHISVVNFFGTIFRGLSLGSILLVVALGLAITFGLMGVINMAHGEMIAVGAYTCYVVQNIFGTGFGFSITLPFHIGAKPITFGLHIPGMNTSGLLYESYFLFALPLSFLMAALAGLVIERSVIRFLYRRPLESLLATWGISLIMQQLFRMVFGANNVQVNSPSWLLGHFSLNDIIFGYNRVFVIGFAVLIVVGTWLLLTKTPLGLLIRAVMQNRDMASCIGVRTDRVNMLTFALGSGLAGLAGAFLSQIGNVGPSLGQTYIVDSFMTVVVGGVGSIVGTVCSAVSIGTGDQMLQQLTGSPVTGKIVMLIAIILFLQWKPGGLFAIRTRSLD